MNLAFNTADPDEPVHAALMVLGILNADQSAKVMAAWRRPRRSARAKTNGHAEPKATNGHTEPRDANGQLTALDPEVERDRLREVGKTKGVVWFRDLLAKHGAKRIADLSDAQVRVLLQQHGL